MLGVQIKKESKTDILEKIKKYLLHPHGFFHIVSLNPENMVIAQKDHVFKEVLNKAQIKLIDGVGVVLAGRILHRDLGKRTPGVDFMENLLHIASLGRLRVVLIGGRGNLAETLADCYNREFSEAKFLGLEGFKDIRKPKESESKKLFSIVADYKPHFLFAAFGSPDQELWLWRNRRHFEGIVCMGVGGGFDFPAGRVRRAPLLVRKLGFEWLYRLVLQPWRIKRQLRLPLFLWLVFKEKLTPGSS